MVQRGGFEKERERKREREKGEEERRGIKRKREEKRERRRGGGRNAPANEKSWCSPCVMLYVTYAKQGKSRMSHDAVVREVC